MRDELRESFALLLCRTEAWVWIAKPSESRIKKFICRRSAPTGALSVKRPAKNQLRRTVFFSSHSSEPMVNERRLTDPGPGNDCYHINILVCPCAVQKSDVLFPTKNIASSNGQPGYGNLLWYKSCLRLASSDTRIGRVAFLNALTSDSTPCAWLTTSADSLLPQRRR